MIIQHGSHEENSSLGATQTSYELHEIATNAAVGYFLTPLLLAAQATNSNPVGTALLAIPLVALALPAAPLAIGYATYKAHQQANKERAEFKQRYPNATTERKPSVGTLWT